MSLKIISFRTCNTAFDETSCLYNYQSSGNTKIRHSINANNFLFVRILMPTFVPILQRNKYVYISTWLFNKVVDWNGTSPSHAMYCPNSNWILVTKIDLLTIVNRFLNDSQSHMQATTIKLALALRIPIRKDSQLGPFQIMGTSLILCVVQTTSMVHITLFYKNDADDSLSITSHRPNMLLTLSYL
jgi:hypothetical protein